MTIKSQLRTNPLKPRSLTDVYIERELNPVIKEAVQRHNERHGSITIEDSDYTVINPVETVIATDNITVTLPAASGWKRYITLIANGGDITIAVASGDTNNGPASVSSTGLVIMVPDGDNDAWYGG